MEKNYQLIDQYKLVGHIHEFRVDCDNIVCPICHNAMEIQKIEHYAQHEAFEVLRREPVGFGLFSDAVGERQTIRSESKYPVILHCLTCGSELKIYMNDVTVFQREEIVGFRKREPVDLNLAFRKPKL